MTNYNSKYWSWVDDFCYKHSGFKLPCKWCVATCDPDLICDTQFSAEENVKIEEPKFSDDSPGEKFGLRPDYYHEYEAWI